MKKVLLLLPFIFFNSYLFSQEETKSKEILVEAHVNYSYLEDISLPLSYGLETEAKLNNRFSLGGSFTYGSDDFLKRFYINPNIRFYPLKTFNGFFLKTGMTFHQIGTKEESTYLPYPFDDEKISTAGFLSINLGLGFRTIVKDQITVGLSLSMGGPFGSEADGPMIQGSFSTGWAF